MKKLLDWIDHRTGLVAVAGDWFRRPMPGGPAWWFVWPSVIAFLFVTEAITGLVLWMYYSPSAQSAWESVYYIQYEVAGGWLLRAIHHYAAQILLVVAGIYLIQMMLRRAYRAPREFMFWVVLFMALMTLALNLTGDLLPWDQNSYWATHVRTGFLHLLPGIGGPIFKLATGGNEFGHLTLTRFVTLHVGVFTAVFAALIALHAWLAWKLGIESSEPFRSARFSGSAKEQPPEGGTTKQIASYWPGQALRDAVACAVVLVVVLVLACQHGISGEHAGIGLGAPANMAEDFGAARPEWSFRGLFQFRELFPPSLEILPIFVIPGLMVLLFLAMPFLAVRTAGHWFNVGFTLILLGGLAMLSRQSLKTDQADEDHQQKLAAAQEESQRAKELAAAPQGIPVGGALVLLRSDPKTQGPRLFRQYCACCHNYGDSEAPICGTDTPTAPDLYRFASREWLAGFLDPKQISGPKYFGNTRFKKGQMAGFVKNSLTDFTAEDIKQACAALSAEAGLKSQRGSDAKDAAAIKEGNAVLTDACTDCHTFHGKGLTKGPELTGYGSRAWLLGIVGNPAHKRFYGKNNDRMPSYGESPAILTDRDLALLVDWLRGEWYDAEE